jgi:hypothetical protein
VGTDQRSFRHAVVPSFAFIQVRRAYGYAGLASSRALFVTIASQHALMLCFGYPHGPASEIAECALYVKSSRSGWDDTPRPGFYVAVAVINSRSCEGSQHAKIGELLFEATRDAA